MSKEKLTKEHNPLRCCECFADKPLFARLVTSVAAGKGEELEGIALRIAENEDPLFGWISAGFDGDGNEEFYCSEGCAFRD